MADPNDDGCRWSKPDDNSFINDRRAIIDVVSCKGKMIARSKKR